MRNERKTPRSRSSMAEMIREEETKPSRENQAQEKLAAQASLEPFLLGKAPIESCHGLSSFCRQSRAVDDRR